jgi:hypothetical protein
MVKNLLTAETTGVTLRSDDTDVKVYERNFDHVIIEGRVITRPVRETMRSNIKDSLLFFVPLLLFFPSAFFLDHWDALAHNVGQVWHGHLERFSTALLTTALVSILGLAQTWLQIKSSKLIDWTVKAR